MVVKNLHFCRIEYSSGLKTLIQNWNGFSSSEEFRYAINVTLEFFKQNESVENILSDTRKQKVVNSEDVEWVADTINPKLVENGLKKIAFIFPEDIYASLSVGHFIEKSHGFDIGYFDDLEKAKSWIKESHHNKIYQSL